MSPSAPGAIRNDADDVVLVREVAAGSETALAALYDRHGSLVYRSALALSRDRGVAEEVVQETFLALWNRAETFDPRLGSLTSWLIAILRNRSIDRIRAVARRVPAVPFSTIVSDQPDESASTDWLVSAGQVLVAGAPEPTPDDVVAARERGQVVAAALAALEEPERLAILLAYRDGLSQSEIAERLGWPLGTVKTRSRRALHHLRDILGDEAPSSMPKSDSTTIAVEAGAQASPIGGHAPGGFSYAHVSRHP
jgi:RNA polymerase sigma-70 factor (ECF subfamily)